VDSSFRVLATARFGVFPSVAPYHHVLSADALAQPEIATVNVAEKLDGLERSNGQTSSILKFLVRWDAAGDDFRRIDVFTHIGFSESRALQGSGFRAEMVTALSEAGQDPPSMRAGNHPLQVRPRPWSPSQTVRTFRNS
jgi:hypothetical protein